MSKSSGERPVTVARSGADVGPLAERAMAGRACFREHGLALLGPARQREGGAERIDQRLPVASRPPTRSPGSCTARARIRGSLCVRSCLARSGSMSPGTRAFDSRRREQALDPVAAGEQDLGGLAPDDRAHGLPLGQHQRAHRRVGEARPGPATPRAGPGRGWRESSELGKDLRAPGPARPSPGDAIAGSLRSIGPSPRATCAASASRAAIRPDAGPFHDARRRSAGSLQPPPDRQHDASQHVRVDARIDEPGDQPPDRRRVAPRADHEGQLVEPGAARIGLEEALRPSTPAPRSARTTCRGSSSARPSASRRRRHRGRRSSPGPGSPGSRPGPRPARGRPGTGPWGRGRRPGRGALRGRAGDFATRLLGQLGGLLADPRLGILQAQDQRPLLERPEDVERPEGVHPAEGRSACATRAPSRSGTADVSRRSIKSRWAVSRHQASGSASRATSSAVVARLELRHAVSGWSLGDEVVEPAAVLAAGQVEVLLDRLGDRERVLDRLAVHVEDQQRAVGRVGEVDRPEPVVGRGQELDLRVGPRREVTRAVDRQDLAVDEVAADVADEGVAAVFRRDRPSRGRS